jgi:hypothetical protein
MWHLEQAALIMGGVPVQGGEEAEVAYEGIMLLEAVIKNVQDKVWVDKLHKEKKGAPGGGRSKVCSGGGVAGGRLEAGVGMMGISGCSKKEDHCCTWCKWELP